MRRDRRSRFTIDLTLGVYVVSTMLLGFGALQSQNNLLFVAFGFAIGAILVSGSVASITLRSIDVRRVAPERVVAARPATIRYRLENRSRWAPGAALVVRELDAERRGGAWSAARTGAVLSVPARSVRRASLRLTARRRGRVALDRVEVSTRFPFGVVRKAVVISIPETLLAHPDPAPPPASLHAAMRTAFTQARRVAHAGREPEVLGLREYQPGDPVRSIAWRATARYGEPLVREGESTQSDGLIVRLRLDRDAGEAANERAVSLAAGVALEARTRGVPVGLLAPGGVSIPPSHGGTEGEVDPCFDALATVAPGGEPPAARGTRAAVFEIDARRFAGAPGDAP